jgi:penicillin-binding protein 2
MCAIANGGKVYDAHIVDKIIDSQGNVIQDIEPTLVKDLQIPESFRKTIMAGMEQVVSLEDGGTAGSAFRDFEYQDIIAGKTGTAPISNIELEDNVWLCLVAPKDDPEIAVVLFLPNGYSNSKAYPTAKAIISYYFDSQKAKANQNPEEGSLIN